MGNIKAYDIAAFLKAELSGQNITINSVSSLSNPKRNSLLFAKKSFDHKGENSFLVICTKAVFEEISIKTGSSFIVVSNPRLAFAKVVQHFFDEKTTPFIHPTVVVAEDAVIHPSVSIGAYCVVESGVSIGEGTVIKNHVVISDNVKIGKFCYIKSGAVIGEEGFGFDFEQDKTPVRLPHLGSVEIGDYVEIGSNSIVARGTLDNTEISDSVKIDDQVFIAHNVKIKRGSLLIAGAIVSGSVEINDSVWVGPNASIIQKTKIGQGAMIGLGTVVTTDVDSAKKIMGFSGVPLKTLIKFMKILKGG